MKPATRKMVLQRMKELGYVPNRHAQQLASGRSRMIALHHGSDEILSEMFLMELVRGIQHALYEYGYGLLLDTTSRVGAEDSLLDEWIRSQAITGVILVDYPNASPEWARQMASPRIPFVAIADSSVPELWTPNLPCIASIGFDEAPVARDVARLLIDAGHRRIGYIGDRALMPDALLTAFRQRLQALDVALEEEYVVIGGESVEDGERAMSALLALPSPPTAVFARKDILAVGAMRAAHRRGVRVPQQLSLVGHDDVPIAAMMDPPLTTVRVDCFELGRMATISLLSMLEQPGIAVEKRFLQPTLVVRESVCSAPAP